MVKDKETIEKKYALIIKIIDIEILKIICKSKILLTLLKKQRAGLEPAKTCSAGKRSSRCATSAI